MKRDESNAQFAEAWALGLAFLNSVFSTKTESVSELLGRCTMAQGALQSMSRALDEVRKLPDEVMVAMKAQEMLLLGNDGTPHVESPWSEHMALTSRPTLADS